MGGVADRRRLERSRDRLGPDGTFREESEDARKQRLESARRRLREIAEIPNEPNDPPDEEWMRASDEFRPYRPVFKGSY